MFNWLWKLLGLSKEEKPVSIDINSQFIHYRLNDPTTPKLTIDIVIPKSIANMPFRVLGYVGGGHPIDSLEGQAANCYVTMANATKLIQSYLDKPIKGWAATTALIINPRAGQDLNAYYDRRSLKFFYTPDKKLGKIVYTSDSADVVAHELGHALLDALRPDLWNLQSLETMGFHEAYGDINAILSILSYKEVIDYVLNETGGNLKKDNIVSRLAEELGTALYNMGYGKNGVLRDAINSFVYVKPETLPQEGSDDQLLGECHSFGQLFMGAWYDMLVGIYELECKTSSPAEALAKARDITGKYILVGASQAPATTRFYDSVARTMLTWGKINSKPEYNAIIQNILEKRKILAPRIKMLTNIQFESLSLLPDDQVLQLTKKTKAVKRKRIEKITLSNELGLSALGSNPLFNAEIEIPRDTYLEFDEAGNLVDEIGDTKDEAIESARVSLIRLHNLGLVGNTDKSEFELKQEGDKQSLVRTKFIN